MDLLYVSPRTAPGDPPSAARERVARLVGLAVAAGHSVRWLVPTAVEERVLAPAGVEVIACPGEVPPAHRVQERLYQVDLEVRLAATVRARVPDVVHVDGYGGVSSYLASWIPARLGARVVAVVDSLEDLLCARRTLRDETGAVCDAWDDPERCQICCSRPCGGGPPDGESPRWRGVLSRATRGLGPLSWTPRVGDYANRLDLVIHGLDAASLVLVPGESAKQALQRARLPMRAVVAGYPAEADFEAWLTVYRSISPR